jgi:excisionase family DNA binding protein
MSAKTITLIPPKNTELLSSYEASTYLGVSPGTLEVWRCTKRYAIPFIKVGRLVRYRKSALDNFLQQQTVEAKGGD